MSKKIITGVVATLTVFSFLAGFTPNAGAQTVVTTTTTTNTSFVYTRDLTIGSTGADVVALQTLLVAQGHLVMPVGVAMGYFGPLTQSSLAKYQAVNGITPAVGYFGPITRAYVNTHGVVTLPGTNLPAGCQVGFLFSPLTGQPCNGSTLPAGCVSTAGYSPITGVKCDGTGSSTSGGGTTGGTVLSGGEASFRNVDVSDADNTSIKEGASKAKVARIEFDLKDGDARLDRADIIFEGSGNEEDRPWRVFDKVYLLDNSGKVIASASSDSKTNWNETDHNDIYKIRISGINQVYKQNSDNTLYVAVDVSNNVDGADNNDANWSVEIASDQGDRNGLRFLDGKGINTEIGSSSTADFDIKEAGSDSEFTVTEAKESPDSITLESKATQTKEYTLAIFNLSADENGDDIRLNDFPVKITIDNAGSPTSTFANVVSDVYVKIDGIKYKGDYISNSCGSGKSTLSGCVDGDTATFKFNNIDDDDIIIKAGDEMDAEVSVKFKAQGNGQTNYADGTTVLAASAVTSNDVEDADSGNDINDVSGIAEGELFTLASQGFGVKTSTITAKLEGNDTIGAYTFKVDVTAFGGDQYVELSGDRGTSLSGSGFNFLILDGTNSVVTDGTSTVAVDSTEEEDGSNRVKVSEGKTVTFTFQVFFDADISGPYKAQLYSVNFNSTNSDPNSRQILSPQSSYRSPSVYVQAS